MISLVIFGVAGYACSQAIENPGIEIWVMIFIGAIVGGLFSILYFKPCTYVQHEFSIKNLVLGLIPYLVLLPGIIALLYSVRVQISNHGPFHTAYILQIINGSVPPENVVLPGFPANVYWLYHALLAVFVYVFASPPPFVSAAVNMLALIVSIYWINKAIGVTNLSNKSSFIRSSYTLLILFGTNLFGVIHIVFRYMIFENPGESNYSISEFINWITYNSMLLAGEDRLVNLAKKFFNFNGNPLGIIYLSFALYISIRVVKGELSTKNIILFVLASAGALIYHTTTGVYILLVIPVSILGVLLFCNKNSITRYFRSTKLQELVVLCAISLVLLIPSITYVYQISTALPVKTQIGATVSYNLLSIFSAAYPLIPISLVAIIVAFRKNREIILLLTTVSVLGYLYSIIFSLPDYNQYKFIFSSTIALGFLCAIGLDYIYYNLKGKLKLPGKLLFIAVFIILGLNILLTGFGYIKSDRYGSNLYYYNNKRIELREGAKFKEEFDWIRENAPTDIIVIMPFPTKNTGRDEVINGNVYIIAERLPYVAYGHIFADGIDEYRHRRKNIKLFYSDSTRIKKKIQILGEFEMFSRKRPSILLVPKKDLKSLSPYLDNLQMIYGGKDANLYSFGLE